VAWDLSDRYEAEERRRLITHVFDHSSEAIVILDDQHRVVDFNKAVTTITGYTLSDVKGLKGRSLARGGESDSLFDTIENQMTRDSGWHGELTILRKEGPPCPVYCNVTPIRDEAGKIINWGIFVTDLSERKASEARLESLANIDQLTRLPNRQASPNCSATGWPPARRAPSSLSMSTNWHGSMTPSVTRPAISCSPRSPGACAACSAGKDILGHLGGGLFAVIVEDGHNLAGLETLTRKLIDSVSYPFRFENADIIPTACAGITLSRRMATTPPNCCVTPTSRCTAPRNTG
jgi:PAS domain S-box-containing protein